MVGESWPRLLRGRTAPVHPSVSTTAVQHRDRCPSRARPNSRMSSIAHTRQVTVTRTICGVDVASKSLEARIGQQGAAGSFANNPEGIAALGAFCQAHQADLVAMEATGGYEQQAFAQLSDQGLPIALLNPRAVRQFAQSMGSLEKTDRIDAGDRHAVEQDHFQTRRSRPSGKRLRQASGQTCSARRSPCGT